MDSVQDYNMNFNSRTKVNFEGGNLTSDAGLLLYKEFDHKIGLSEAVKEMLVIHDPICHRNHSNSDVALQKLYQHLAGYHTDVNGFGCHKMSSTDFESNAVKLQLAMLAYNFNNWFCRLCLPEQMKSNRMETLRLKLVKIAGKPVSKILSFMHQVLNNYLFLIIFLI
ncbi:MAG: transposase [Clostridiales bacterium]|nr:transposase [Clostridiales bacterium]MCF8023493.1 transposase [Clostridiales bacterium]